MNLQYRVISKFYDLVDVFYFNNIETSPRKGVLEFIPDKKLKLLEVCTGTAANSIIIAENRINSEIIGIDLSQEMLAIAKEKIDKGGIGNINTVAMDATKMSFGDKCFDLVLISLVLHEIDEKTRCKMLEEIKRVLKDNGKIIIVEWDRPKSLLKKLLFAIIELLEPKGFNEFLLIDFKQYLDKFSLKILNEKKYDYTRIIEVTK